MSYGNTVVNFGIISEEVIQAVLDECNKAHDKHGQQSMLYGDDAKSLRILMEEVGELAREANEFALGNRHALQYTMNTYQEAIQVAAMAATWAQKIRKQMGE
jgi:hypothetical protein